MYPVMVRTEPPGATARHPPQLLERSPGEDPRLTAQFVAGEVSVIDDGGDKDDD